MGVQQYCKLCASKDPAAPLGINVFNLTKGQKTHVKAFSVNNFGLRAPKHPKFKTGLAWSGRAHGMWTGFLDFIEDRIQEQTLATPRPWPPGNYLREPPSETPKIIYMNSRPNHLHELKTRAKLQTKPVHVNVFHNITS